jgi:hypothetical protein
MRVPGEPPYNKPLWKGPPGFPGEHKEVWVPAGR